MNSELAFNLNGEPFDVPANAAGWRVRRMKSKGAPEVVYARNGLPLVLPIEADLDDVRTETGIPGRYRLDPVDESNRPIANASAGYVYVHEQRTDATNPRSAGATSTEGIVIEAMRMNAEIARSVVDRFNQMVEAAATLLRAADGAGLPKREPRDIDEDEDDDDNAPTSRATQGFDLGAVITQLLPMAMMALGKSKLDVASALDWRKATPQGDAKKLATKSERPDGPGDVVQPAKPKTEESNTDGLPPIGPQTMAHFIAIQSALKPEEAAVARQVASELAPAELRAWFDELTKLTVPQAVQKIRTLIAGNAEAVP